ncbi:MAG: FG-GAP repeat domain-containing protein [Candidatus Microsaccharimonas sp.]
MKLRTQLALAVVGVTIGALAFTQSASAAGSAYADMVGMRADGTLWVYRNNGKTIAPYSNGAKQIGQGWQGFDQIHLADLNGDRRAEAIGVNLAGKSADKVTTNIWAYKHSGSTTTPYSKSQHFSTKNTSATTQAGVAFGDTLSFNGTNCVGRANMISINSNSTSQGDLTQVLQNNSYTNNNAIGFSQSLANKSANWGSSFKASDYTQYRLGDVTGNGCDDIVALKKNGTLWLFEATKTGAFTTPGRQIGHGWSNFDTVLTGDMNADGYADIVARNKNGTLWYYANSGNRAAPYSSGKQIGHGWNIFTKLMLGEV